MCFIASINKWVFNGLGYLDELFAVLSRAEEKRSKSFVTPRPWLGPAETRPIRPSARSKANLSPLASPFIRQA